MKKLSSNDLFRNFIIYLNLLYEYEELFIFDIYKMKERLNIDKREYRNKHLQNYYKNYILIPSNSFGGPLKLYIPRCDDHDLLYEEGKRKVKELWMEVFNHVKYNSYMKNISNISKFLTKYLKLHFDTENYDKIDLDNIMNYHQDLLKLNPEIKDLYNSSITYLEGIMSLSREDYISYVILLDKQSDDDRLENSISFLKYIYNKYMK